VIGADGTIVSAVAPLGDATITGDAPVAVESRADRRANTGGIGGAWVSAQRFRRRDVHRLRHHRQHRVEYWWRHLGRKTVL
jgi:hypothetical protein